MSMISALNIILAILVTGLLGIVLFVITNGKLPPGPYGLPIIGYLAFLDPKNPHITLQNLAKRYGPVFSIRLGSVLTIVLADEKSVREFLKRDEFTARAPLYVTHGIMGGYGLICAEGTRWKDQRRQVIDWLKCLGMKKLKVAGSRSLELRIRKGAQEFLQLLRDDADKTFGKVDPLPALHHSLGNVVNSLVFGITYARDDVTWRYLQCLQEEGLKLIGVSGVVNFLPFLRFLPTNRQSIEFLLDGKKKTHRIYDSIISECQKRLQYNNKEHTCILEYFLLERESRKNSPDVNIQKSADLYSDEQLRHLLADMYGASVDSTLTTLRWFLLFMTLNTECQSKLQYYLSQSQLQITSEEEEELTLSDLGNIDYLRACIAETQRIRIVVPLGIPHGAKRDCEVLGYKIPKNSMILPLMWAIHMNEEVWQNPEEFRPERFLNEQGKFEQHKSMIPFLTGKRMCVGEDMAHMMLLIYAGLIFSRYTLKLAKAYENIDISGECGITLAPPPFELIVHDRKEI